MSSSQVRRIQTIDVHAEGEPGRVLLAPDLGIRGDDMSERFAWCRDNLDDLRRLLLQEPRGYPALCGVIVMPPVNEGSDISLVVLEHGGFRPMSGSNTLCAVTAVLESGHLPASEPTTVVRIDTAAGLVEATARVSGGKVLDVQVRNVPSWVEVLDAPVEVPEYGTIVSDVAFGGQYYVQAPASAFGLTLDLDNSGALVRAGMALLAAAREQVSVAHPSDPALSLISLVMLHGPAQRPGTSGKNAVILPTGAPVVGRPDSWRGVFDRSPCGTGTSARMACLHARGQLALGEAFIHEGMLGTTFEGILQEQVEVAGRPAVVPSIRGRAWVTARGEQLLDPTDPFPRGFMLADLWGQSST